MQYEWSTLTMLKLFCSRCSLSNLRHLDNAPLSVLIWLLSAYRAFKAWKLRSSWGNRSSLLYEVSSKASFVFGIISGNSPSMEERSFSLMKSHSNPARFLYTMKKNLVQIKLCYMCLFVLSSNNKSEVLLKAYNVRIISLI